MFNPSTFSLTDVFTISQSVGFLKWVFLMIIIFFIFFLFIIFTQLRSMNRVITQQASSTVLFFITVILLVVSVGLGIFVLRL